MRSYAMFLVTDVISLVASGKGYHGKKCRKYRKM